MTGHRVLAISGGIGGAKLSLGLYLALEPDSLGVIVNTGDDFEHLGLNISPDIDTLVYTLSGLVDTATGWGRANETWHCLDSLATLGADSWFRLGDRDLAMHVARTRQLGDGDTLSEFTAHAATRMGVRAAILPMSDDPVRTMVDTTRGVLEFQDYFVRRQCEPVVTGLGYAGARQASLPATTKAWLNDRTLEAIVICPSNPYLSVAPVLATSDIAARIRSHPAPVVAVSPLVGGKAIKGPTAKIMRELDLEVTNATIAEYYSGLIDGFVIDEIDKSDVAGIEKYDMQVKITKTLMQSERDRIDLAQATLAFAAELRNDSDAR